MIVETRTHKKKTLVEIDRCPDHGIWLDDGKLEILIKAAPLIPRRSAIRDWNREAGWFGGFGAGGGDG